MRHVILRDDDTNALTPVECLERLYRPFLDRGLPVNLAAIPEVATNAHTPDGAPEEFLFNRNGNPAEFLPLAVNTKLVHYLRENPGYHVAQHGCHHQPAEFGALNRVQARLRLERGAEALMSAGLPSPCAFVAPHDKFSPGSMAEAAARFPVVSTGWFELRRLPWSWWPAYAMKKLRRVGHWRRGGAWLLSHPGCLLSRNRPREDMINTIIDHLRGRRLTVLVTHWWEYFPNGCPDEEFVAVLHQLADYLARQDDITVVSFAQLPSCITREDVADSL